MKILKDKMKFKNFFLCKIFVDIKCKVCNKMVWDSLDWIKQYNGHVMKEKVLYTEGYDVGYGCRIWKAFIYIYDLEVWEKVLKHVKNTMKTK